MGSMASSSSEWSWPSSVSRRVSCSSRCTVGTLAGEGRKDMKEKRKEGVCVYDGERVTPSSGSAHLLVIAVTVLTYRSGRMPNMERSRPH